MNKVFKHSITIFMLSVLFFSFSGCGKQPEDASKSLKSNKEIVIDEEIQTTILENKNNLQNELEARFGVGAMDNQNKNLSPEEMILQKEMELKNRFGIESSNDDNKSDITPEESLKQSQTELKTRFGAAGE